MRKRFISWVTLILILLFSCRCMADGSLRCELRDDKWTWNPGKEATLSGEIRNDGETVEDAQLRLEIYDVSGEDPGSVVFTAMNGSRILVRKQKDTYTTTLPSGEETSFTASWFLPENMDGVDRVRFRLTVSDNEGNIRCESEIRMGSYDEDEQTETDTGSLSGILRRITPVLFAAGALLWTAAVLRNKQIKKKNEGE